MGRGGVRLGAGGKPTWKHGKTTTIRVPIALVHQIQDIARKLDSKETIEPETGSKVLKLDGVSVFQQSGRLCVYLDELFNRGYKISPPVLAKRVEQQIAQARASRTSKNTQHLNKNSVSLCQKI